MRCALSSVPRTSSFRHAPGALKKKTALNDDKRESAMFAGGTLQRSASLKFGSGEARSKAQSGEMRVSVLFKLISPTTNRVLHKTIVDGLLLRLTPMQASATCSAGAKTFGDLAACSKHEIAATCRLAQAVVSRLGGECVVQCKTPACPLSLLAHGNSFAATVEVSLSGPDGPFTSDGATFEYIRNPTLKAVSPLGEALVPGRTQVLLKGTGLSKSSFLNLALYGAPEGPTSQPLEFSVSNMDEFEGSASLDHVDLGPRRSFERFSFDRDRPASRPTSSLLPLAPDAFLKAKLPFVVRRRYFSKMPKQLHLFAGAYRRYSLWAHAAPAHVELHESPNTSFREEAATRRERRPSAGSLGRAIDKLAPKRPDYANAMSRPLPRMNSSTTSKGLKSDSYLGGAMPSQQLPALGGRRSSHRGTLPTAPGAKSAAARFAVKKLGLKMERNGDRRTTNVDADYVVNEIGFETSANGQDWDSPGSRTLKLNPPYALSRMEPALGPCRGGTPIVIFGAHFTPNQKCFIAFLCAGASNRTAAHEASRRKSFVSHSDKFVKHLVDSIMPKNAGHDAADTAVFSKVIMKRLYSSAVRIQAMARGMIYRRHSKGGIPCAVVEGLATSSTTITCLSPKVLAPGRVDVAVSYKSGVRSGAAWTELWQRRNRRAAEAKSTGGRGSTAKTLSTSRRRS
ncbi:hypothetical protein M885DRAFT_50486 [Pelagophyceae sp. CCMP2097]|nr:hypothetical protein M885DRAFT_50486 [Pelagophyceae sp. CCMP2097]